MAISNPRTNFDWWQNDASVLTTQHDDFKEILAFVDAPENTQYIHDVKTKDLKLRAICTPMDATPVAAELGLDNLLAFETGQDDGTHLVLIRTNGVGEPLPGPAAQNFCCDNASWPSILNAAKLYGSALQRMDPKNMEECLNNGLAVAIGGSTLLVRFGKLFAVHSDGYVPMPISAIVETTERVITKTLGRMQFVHGFYTHSFTSALWTLPDGSGITAKYADVLRHSKAQMSSVAAMTPGLMMLSSDTQASAARLFPVFNTPNGGVIRLPNPVAVRHEKQRGGKEGLDLYEEEIQDMFAIFSAALEEMGRLATIVIAHPKNCLTSLGQKFDISKKVISMAYEEMVDDIGEDAKGCTAFDIVLAMSNVAAFVSSDAKTISTALDNQEKVAKVMRIKDWSEFDLALV